MDGATLAASSALAANYPLSNLLTIQPGERARFSTPAAAYVEIDLGSAKAVTFAGLLGHNGSATGEWRVRGATSQANLTSSPGYDSGSGGTSLYPTSGKYDADIQHSFMSFASQSYRWWRIDVDDTSNADGYFQAGRIILANAWSPEINFSFGMGIGWIDPSPTEQSVAGHLYPLERPKHRVFTIPFQFQTEADMLGGLYEIERTRGASKDIFVVLDKDDDAQLHRRMLHGLMVGTTAPISLEFFRRYSTSLRVEELLA